MTDTEKTIEKTEKAIGDSVTGAATKIEQAVEPKSFFERAQEAIEDAVETTIEAVKENPITAAAIAGGVVAAAAGAAYGVSKLVGGEDTTDDK